MQKPKQTSSYRLATASALAASALVATAGSDVAPAAASNTASTAAPSTTTAASASLEKKAADSTSGGFEKPAWLSDMALGVKESWDNNLWDVSGSNMAKKSSWITTASPKLGVNFAPLFDKDTGIQTLSLAYTPDYAFYHGSKEESFYAHRFGTVAKVKQGDFSLNIDNGFTYVDGSTTAPTYSGSDSDRSAYATAAPRERRKQIQDRAKVALQYDQEKFFVRPTASLLYYDLMTDQRTTAGYQNYASRYDLNGGLDLGYKMKPDWAWTVGYRYGHQYQEQVLGAANATSSDYQRVLLGTEGKPLNWLTVAVQAGPDFRTYDSLAAMDDKHYVTYYGEASATAQISSKDALIFKYKQWQWVSSTGKVPLFESTYDLTYRRKITDQLSLDLNGKIGESDYTMGDLSKTTSKRDDAIFTLSPSLTYDFTKQLSATLAYTMDLGRNMQEGVDSTPREFDHHLISLGVLYKF